MTREDLINFIPKPTNQDVVVYDLSLKDIIEKDVLEEYQNLLPIYQSKIQEYKTCKANVEEYTQKINKTYLFKSNWSEEDYLFQLQNEKKTYATLYGPIKKIEGNITMLQKKVTIINDKIQMQNIKENKVIEDKKLKLEKNIDKNLDKAVSLKENIATLKIEEENLQRLIQDNQEEFNTIQQVVQEIQSGNCQCKYCGSILKNVSENSRFYKKTQKNLEENKIELEKLLEKKEKNNQKLEEYKKQYKEVMTELRNDTNFKKESTNAYHKKSIEILQLEGERDAMLNNISSLQKELEDNATTKKDNYLKVKEKITKYELSLENLQKIKELKKEMKEYTDKFAPLKAEILEMRAMLEKYKAFLSIYFKIYEQKAADFCGTDFKFKIFDFDEQYNLIEKFEIYYKTIRFENLTPTVQTMVNNLLQQKFVIYD